MKKKLFTILTIAMLLVGVAGQAMAYFEEEGTLIRVVYNLAGEKEVMTDLGAGYNYTLPSTQNTVLNTNNFSLSELNINDWSSVYVVYFAIQPFTADRLWLSGTDAGLNNWRNKWNSTSSATLSVIAGAYDNGYGPAHVVQSQGAQLAYSELIGQAGDYFGHATTPTVHKNLSSFAAEGEQYVDQYLYYFATPNATSSGLQVATIRTYENGTTEINPVPIPAAVYLLGSGLLALVGIRRKTNLEA
jgi:hypothetical protein